LPALPGAAEPASPCVGLCQLNAARVCRGCGRHIDEIAEWSYASAARKREILRASLDRLPVNLRPVPPKA
jgi:predicted Fe-S protein YdhL (DUF1289 family)